MFRGKSLTTIVFSHGPRIMGGNCDLCTLRPIVLDSIDPSDHLMSNQLAETRSFLLNPPKSIKTKFVSFVSYRIAEKTNQQIDIHSACQLVRLQRKCDVVAPYLVKNSIKNMVYPVQGAPEYAFAAKNIYQSLFQLDPVLETKAKLIGEDRIRVFPFCNSFLMSTSVYKEFYKSLTQLVRTSWKLTEFDAEWCQKFTADFPGREYGMLFERFTALWIGLNPSIEVYGNGWGNKYPIVGNQKKLSDLSWKSLDGTIPMAGSAGPQFN